jgi:hypothetical protein
MDVPGLNPLQNRPIVPGQTGPEATPKGVPDLILNAPAGRTPAPPQAPAQAPFQAPSQPIIQHSVQNIMNALLEMGANPSQQNLTIAQNLANYGHPVSNQTLQIVQQALAGLPDRSAATIEAAVILLTQDLPVNSQTVMAMKQFMNGQPLPQQMQNLPKDVGALLQQMQNLPALPASTAVLPPGQAVPALLAGQTAQALPTGQSVPALALSAGQNTPALPAGQTPTLAGASVQLSAAGASALSVPVAPPAATAVQATQAVTGQTTAQVPVAGAINVPTGLPANSVAQPGVLPLGPQTGAIPAGLTQATQQIAQNIQSGQIVGQVAAQSSVVQQAAGQSQAIENRSDGVSKASEQSTALKIQALQNTGSQQQALEAVSGVEGNKNNSQQALNVNQHLQAYSQQEQKALEQLYLHLTGGNLEPIEKINPGGRATQVMSADEGIYRLIQLLGDILQLSGHLSENMQLKDYQQLFIQHQQVIQLTGLMEQKMREFQKLFHSTFPELSRQIQGLLHQDGLDIFGKLAHLIESNQEQLKEQLKHVIGDLEKQQLLQTLTQLLEQVGFQVDKVHSNLMAREMLTQNMPVHCIPLMIHANQERYAAELYIQQDYDPRDPHQRPSSEHPLKVTLTLETHNLGRVSVDMSSLNKDLSLNLKVLTRRVKLLVDERLENLQHKIEKQGHYQQTRLNCIVEPDLATRQSMLLPPKRTVRSLQRIEGIV